MLRYVTCVSYHVCGSYVLLTFSKEQKRQFYHCTRKNGFQHRFQNEGVSRLLNRTKMVGYLEHCSPCSMAN